MWYQFIFGKVNSKSASKSRKKTLGEIKADAHKIKRFLLYETKLKDDKTDTQILENYSYLSAEALQIGFSEQRKDEEFDGGPVLSKIESYLQENFAIPNLPKMIKPSHGMILVILLF